MRPALPALALILVVTAVPALAQVQIDKRRPAPKNGEVHVDNPFGSIKVTGWERDEVHVTGVLAAGAEGLELDGDKEGTYVAVREPEDWRYGAEDDTDFRSALEVRIPRGSRLHVVAVNASVDVDGVVGEVSVGTTNGAVKVQGAAREVAVETMTGTVDVAAAGAATRVESISGAIHIGGAAREVEVRSVSGTVDVQGQALDRVQIETTTGDITLGGSFGTEGGVELESHAGNVTLLVPPDLAGRFRVQTFGGTIASDLGPKPRRSERFSPFLELRFSTGENDFEVEISTYSGKVTLRRSAAPASTAPPTKSSP